MTELLAYIVNGAMWAALFFTVGYLLGKFNRVLNHVEDEVHDIKSKIGEKKE